VPCPGTFLEDPEDVPGVVVGYVGEQMGLVAGDLAGYGRTEHRGDHQDQIRSAHGYTKFEFDQWFALARWMYQRTWIGSERPTLLFALASKRVSELERLRRSPRAGSARPWSATRP